jgi:hypothetical protein
MMSLWKVLTRYRWFTSGLRGINATAVGVILLGGVNIRRTVLNTQSSQPNCVLSTCEYAGRTKLATYNFYMTKRCATQNRLYPRSGVIHFRLLPRHHLHSRVRVVLSYQDLATPRSLPVVSLVVMTISSSPYLLRHPFSPSASTSSSS